MYFDRRHREDCDQLMLHPEIRQCAQKRARKYGIHIRDFYGLGDEILSAVKLEQMSLRPFHFFCSFHLSLRYISMVHALRARQSKDGLCTGGSRRFLGAPFVLPSLISLPCLQLGYSKIESNRYIPLYTTSMFHFRILYRHQN